MNKDTCYTDYANLFSHLPSAVAVVDGGSSYPEINGTVRFYEVSRGVVVVADVCGLPKREGECEKPIFAFHIHEGSSCTGDENYEFADTKGHYNPNMCEHPYHAGDLAPLFGADGVAFLAFLTDRFTVDEIIGKTVVIHELPDDFMTQPSGNSGKKIACGTIGYVRRR